MLKRLLVFTLTLALLGIFGVTNSFAGVTAGNTGWSWSNPQPQGNTLTRVETVAGRAYVGGASGTLLRSDNGGATWTGIRSGLTTDIVAVRAISADSVVFASDCALRRTDDGGVTVKRLPWGSNDISCPSPIVAVSFPTPLVGYLLLQSGDVMATTDGGDSWKKQTAAPTSKASGGGNFVVDIAFTSATSGVVSVGNQIYYTTNQGSSWSPVKTTDGPGLLHFEFTSATQGYAIGQNSSMYVTLDAGATWNAVASDGSTNGENISGLSCVSVSTCLASTSAGTKLLRTTDAGATWTSVTASTAAVFGVGFTSASHAVAVGLGGVTVVTDDTGTTWSSINSAAAGKFDAIHVDTPSSALLMGLGGVLARSVDAGASWKPITTISPDVILDATFPTATRGYVLDSRKVLTRSDDGGSNWKFLDTGGASPKALYAPNANTLFLIGTKGVRKSVDGGITFTPTGGKNFRKLPFTHYDVAGSALFVNGRMAINYTKNLGKTWTQVKRPKRVKSIWQIDFSDAKSGYLLDGNSELWKTSTGGKKWSRIETTGSVYSSALAFGDPKHGFLAESNGPVLETSDGGATWSQQFPDIAAQSKAGFTPLLGMLTSKSAIYAETGSNTVFSTSTLGQVGHESKLTIKASSTKVKKNATVRVTGKLTPAQGGERVTVLTRPVGAKDGKAWRSQTATVSLAGTFTTSWKISGPTIVIATWAGDGGHDGDGASALKISLKK
jgi:photosystem II stability/assembly factor-like uncharacterized protein